MASMKVWPQSLWTVVGSAWACCSCQNDQHTHTGWLGTILFKEWDAIPHQCVTKLVSSMRRRCQAVVAVYDSSTCYSGLCFLNEEIVKLPICLVSPDFSGLNLKWAKAAEDHTGWHSQQLRMRNEWPNSYWLTKVVNRKWKILYLFWWVLVQRTFKNGCMLPSINSFRLLVPFSDYSLAFI